MKTKEIKKIKEDVVKIIQESKATFFVNKNMHIEIPADELMYELRAEICTNVEMYFYRLLEK